MILFDYVYYLCCRFYRKFKEERVLHVWRGSGMAVASGFASFIVFDIGYVLHKFTDFEFVTMGRVLIAIAVVFILCNIYYDKFTRYTKIRKQVQHFSKCKKRLLNIAVVIYIFLGMPLMIILIAIFGPVER